jgi:TatD DNase family protein
MFIDTHCHLTEKYADDISAVIARASNAGVGKLIAISADPTDPENLIALADKYDDVFITMGVHPQYAGQCEPDYEHLLNHPKVLAIGEIGLDYYYPEYDRDAQIKLFRAQMEIAEKHKMSIAIHSREAAADTAEILCDTNYANVIGVMHCTYTNWDLVKKMLDRGYYISTSGTLTFKNKDEAREIFKRVPIDRILIETDSPYLAPEPFRGKTCEPAMVIETAKVLAQIRGLQLDELEQIIECNAYALYPPLCAHPSLRGGAKPKA